MEYDRICEKLQKAGYRKEPIKSKAILFWTPKKSVVVVNNYYTFFFSNSGIDNWEEKIKKAYNTEKVLFVIAGNTVLKTLRKNVLICGKKGTKYFNIDSDFAAEKKLFIESVKEEKEHRLWRATASKNTNNAIPLATYLLVIACCYIYYKLGKNQGVAYGISKEYNAEHFRLITYQFFHASIFHLTGNMLSLLFIGSVYEKRNGFTRLLSIYLLGGIIAGLFSINFKLLSIPTVGASGAIFAIYGAYAMSQYEEEGLNGLWKSLKFVLLLVIFNARGLRTDNWCHIGGVIGGLVLHLIFTIFDETYKDKMYVKLTKKKLERNEYITPIRY